MTVQRFVLLILGASATLCAGCIAPDHVYLTWDNPDTSTTVTVQFHTSDQQASTVFFDSVSHAGETESSYAFSAAGASHQVPELIGGRYIHSVTLTGLAPGQRYYFRIAGSETERQFTTLPNDGTLIRFVVGGSMGVLPLETRMLRRAAEQNPDFAVLGGGLAYDFGELENAAEWDTWLKRWEANMVQSDGDMIPLIAAIGDEEVNEEKGSFEQRAPFYAHYFDQGGSTSFAREIGPQATLLVLDTGHIQPHAAQVPFIQEALAQYQERDFLFAAYHVPLYPSHFGFSRGPSEQGRNLWQPLFDAFALNAAFEHHDGTLKRTRPLRENQVHPQGTIYLGDGAMGIFAQEVRNRGQWYMANAEQTPNLWLVSISASGSNARALNQFGDIVDEVQLRSRRD